MNWDELPRLVGMITVGTAILGLVAWLVYGTRPMD